MVGVPLITPLEVLKLNPVGNVGLMPYEVTVPVTVGLALVINTP